MGTNLRFGGRGGGVASAALLLPLLVPCVANREEVEEVEEVVAVTEVVEVEVAEALLVAGTAAGACGTPAARPTPAGRRLLRNLVSWPYQIIKM